MRNQFHEDRFKRTESATEDVKKNISSIEDAIQKLQAAEMATSVALNTVQVHLNNLSEKIGKNEENDGKNIETIKTDLNSRFQALNDEKKDKKGTFFQWLTISVASIALLKEVLIELIKRLLNMGGQ